MVSWADLILFLLLAFILEALFIVNRNKRRKGKERYNLFLLYFKSATGPDAAQFPVSSDANRPCFGGTAEGRGVFFSPERQRGFSSSPKQRKEAEQKGE